MFRFCLKARTRNDKWGAVITYIKLQTCEGVCVCVWMGVGGGVEGGAVVVG